MKRRFGSVIRSNVSGLGRMMNEHFKDVQDWMVDRMVPEEEKLGDEMVEDT